MGIKIEVQDGDYSVKLKADTEQEYATAVQTSIKAGLSFQNPHRTWLLENFGGGNSPVPVEVETVNRQVTRNLPPAAQRLLAEAQNQYFQIPQTPEVPPPQHFPGFPDFDTGSPTEVAGSPPEVTYPLPGSRKSELGSPVEAGSQPWEVPTQKPEVKTRKSEVQRKSSGSLWKLLLKHGEAISWWILAGSVAVLIGSAVAYFSKAPSTPTKLPPPPAANPTNKKPAPKTDNGIKPLPVPFPPPPPQQ